jgi:hypothetical protein
MEKVIERVKQIIVAPREALASAKSEVWETQLVLKEYVAVLAAIPAVAQFIGRVVVGHPLLPKPNFFKALLFSVILYGLSVVGVVLLGKILAALAPNFASDKDDQNAFKLAVCVFTPSFVAGAFSMVPALSAVWLFGGIYGIYILYIGLPILLNTPQDKVQVFTVVGTLVWIALTLAISYLATSLAGMHGY